MDEQISRALHIAPDAPGRDRTIDITTYGARSGQPRRIEIWFYRVGEHWYLTGRPAPRDWYANLAKDPRLIVHLKHGVRADLTATARLITEEAERRQVLTAIVDGLNRMDRPGVASFDVEEWIAGSPLAEIAFETTPPLTTLND